VKEHVPTCGEELRQAGAAGSFVERPPVIRRQKGENGRQGPSRNRVVMSASRLWRKGRGEEADQEAG